MQQQRLTAFTCQKQICKLHFTLLTCMEPIMKVNLVHVYKQKRSKVSSIIILIIGFLLLPGMSYKLHLLRFRGGG